jgi:hypothetical protein
MKRIKIAYLKFMIWWHETDVKAIPKEIEMLLAEKYEAQGKALAMRVRLHDEIHGKPSRF